MATHFVGAGAPDSPLEVTRFEFTIKSCRCTKTSEGVGTSDFCKAEIAPLPYNAEIMQILNTGDKRSPLNIFGIVYLAAKSLRSLRVYIALRDSKAVQILYSDITFI